MRRELIVLAIAIAMMTVALPTGMASHFSAGADAAPGAGADESPQDPTVPGPEHVDDGFEGETPYEVGTRTDCYDAEGNLSTAEVEEAAATHGFCGHLYYNDDLPVDTFERPSPVDQDLRSAGGLEIGTFDAQRSFYVGPLVGLIPCQPMCDDTDDEIPVAGEPMPVAPQNELWYAFHNTASDFGLTQSGEDANDTHGDNRDNFIGFRFDPAHAGGIVQRSTDAWQMNGWSIPYALETWVAFLQDGDGNIIQPADIESAVENGTDGDQKELAAGTTPQVCGYSPDYSYVSTGEQTFCHIPMSFNGPDEDNERGDATFSGDHPCHSPTYFCGPTTGGPYWSSNVLCVAGCYGGEEQVDYTTFHWVVAPNEPECGSIDPAFDVDGDGASNPYLAHDLDVQTPVNALATGPTVAQDHLEDYADAVTDVPGLPDVTDTEFAYDTVRNDTEVATDSLLEPNHLGAEDYGIDDNSRMEINLDRGETTDCEELTTDTLKDPWVNYIDNGVVHNRGASFYSGVTGVDEYPPNVGLYGDGESQDEENDPTTDLYQTDGFVGIFTDKNDDGDYDQRIGNDNADDGFGQSIYQADTISGTGAYPMLWDMRVTLNETSGEVSPNDGGGCGLTTETTIVDEMVAAGYGPNTGIAQAIYLNEPTAFTDGSLADPQVAPYADGNNIYVLGSQAVRELWDGEIGDGTDDHQLSEDVDGLVEELQAFVVEKYDADESTLQILQPGDELDLNTDYDAQCGENTGGYDSILSFTHTCETDCSGDTIATMYSFEVNSTDGTIGGGEIPTFLPEDPHDFGEGGTWYDIDAFDGDATRNEERMDPPPSEEEA